MNNKNNNYRVMKFLEPVNKSDKSKGYVRLDIRGIRGTIIVSVENLGDSKTTSEVYLYKDKKNKIKIGSVNNKKGMIKKAISIGNNTSNLEDYNICGVVKNDKIVLYANLFNTVNINDIRKLEETIQAESIEENAYEDVKNSNDNDNDLDLQVEVDEKEIADVIIGERGVEIEKEAEIEEVKIEKAKESSVFNDYSSQNTDISEPKSEEINAMESGMVDKNEEVDVKLTSKKMVYKNKFEENLYNVLREYIKLDPLSVDIKNMSWWKIPYDDRGVKNGFLPYYDQIISSYYPYPMSNRVTTCHGLMRKYGYYIFGIYKENNDIKKFVYGIPGEFKRDEQPYKGVTGFKNWSYKNKEISGDYGFWLAFVDSSTGGVSEPPQIVLGK